MSPLALSYGLAGFFGLLALIHLAWMLGLRWGVGFAIPEVDGRPLFAPGPTQTLLMGALFATAGWLALGCAGVVGTALPQGLFQWGTALVALLFLRRAIGNFFAVGFTKRIADTRFAYWDDRLFAPLSLLVSILSFWLVATTP